MAHLVACSTPVLFLAGVVLWLYARKETPDLRVVLSGELRGTLEPCGCFKGMLGGLSRRATAIERLRADGSDNLIVLDGGDVIAEPGRQQELKLATAMDAFALMGVLAVAVGEGDLLAGPAVLLAEARRAKVRLVCANVTFEDAGAAVEPFLVLPTARGRVLVAAVLEPELIAGLPGVRAHDAVVALARAVREPADLRILIAHGRRAWAEQVAAAVPGFDIVAAGHAGGAPLRETREVGGAQVVEWEERGKTLTTIGVSLRPRVRCGPVEHAPLTDAFAGAPAMQKVIGTYQARVAAEALLYTVPKRRNAPGGEFAGSASCATCHPQAHVVWLASRHGHAYRTLETRGYDRDPECVVCHVVGFDVDKGFLGPEETPHLEDVGCEACHGPAAAHAGDPLRVKPDRTGGDCRSCHVPDHSPEFRLPGYWKKIEHGRS